MPEEHPASDPNGKFAVVRFSRKKRMNFKFWHPTKEAAEAEATRLASEEGGTYAIIKRIGHVAGKTKDAVV